MIRVGLPGTSGRMHALLEREIATQADMTLAATGRDADALMAACDVAIDCTVPEALPGLLDAAIRHQCAYVCCTTGLDVAPLRAAAAHIPVLYAANTSWSLVVMKRAVQLAASMLDGYDIAVTDEHHAAKRDAPSGTALVLGRVAEGAGGRPVQYASIRAGDIVGEHEVVFAGAGEVLRLRHSITDRAVFARGALRAARFLAGREAGFYTMEDVIGL